MFASLQTTAQNLLSPPILFFVLGALAALVRSDLHIPREVTAGISLYLMMAIGLRGGFEIAHAGLTAQVAGTAVAAVALGLIIPVIAFLILTRVGRIDPINAGAIAAHYGSVSAVTFVTATNFLTQLGVPFQGFMVAVMALMEAPGIVCGILLARLFSTREEAENGNGEGSIGAIVRESVFGASTLMLLGSFAIGLLTGDKGKAVLDPYVNQIFTGVLSLFLLDMGLTAARRLADFARLGRFLGIFGLIMPLIGASLGLLAAKLAGLGVGEATLMAALAASGSYIAAPAAVRMALPQANPSLSITLSLGVTFPFNILVGIPIYYQMARWLFQ